MNTQENTHQDTRERIVAFVMEQIEDRGYDLSDLGGKTCEEIANELGNESAMKQLTAQRDELLAALKSGERELEEGVMSGVVAQHLRSAIAKAESNQT